MEILWPALGISLIVVFLFIVFMQHWQRVLRHHSWTIRRLTERLRDLEDVGDPEFQRRLHATAPSPLQQVLTLSLRLDERFWRDTLRVDPEDLKFIRASGSILGAVKIERWRGHSVIRVTELPPESRLAGWQIRRVDLYSRNSAHAEAVTLWEMPLERPHNLAGRTTSLELLLIGNSILLCRSQAAIISGNATSESRPKEESILFRVPLDTSRLAEFRSLEPTSHSEAAAANGNSWLASYSCEDENLGLEWQLSVRDLTRRVEWENWKVLDSAPAESESELQSADVTADVGGQEVPTRR